MVAKEIEKYLRRLYHNAKKPGSFGGVSALYRAAHADGRSDITLSQVPQFLRSDDTYTLFKPARRRFKRSRIIVGGIDEEYQMDLADLSKWKKYNDNYAYILVAIDAFPRFLYTYPLKDKTAETVVQALIVFLKQTRRPRVSVYTDKGREWVNTKIENLFSEYGLKHFKSQNSDVKASMAERVILDLKRHLTRYMSENETYRYIDVLNYFTTAHNYTFNRVIGMEPIQVTRENEKELWRHLYLKDPKLNKKSHGISVPQGGSKNLSIEKGDYVRISYARHPFTRGYQDQWTGEFFQVYKLIVRDGHRIFFLREFNGDPIVGGFYEQEIQKIIITPNKFYKIEKILNSKKIGNRKMVYVKFKYWPTSYNMWLPYGQVKKLA